MTQPSVPEGHLYYLAGGTFNGKADRFALYLYQGLFDTLRTV
jgi:hypothetical protein